jgi:hypothetical protein
MTRSMSLNCGEIVNAPDREYEAPLLTQIYTSMALPLIQSKSEMFRLPLPASPPGLRLLIRS